MELIDGLNTSLWQKADPDMYSDFKPYTIIRARPMPPGEFEMAVKQLTDDGDIPHIMAVFRGVHGKSNPLGGIRNCDLLVEEREIVGINVDGDCVVKKELAK